MTEFSRPMYLCRLFLCGLLATVDTAFASGQETVVTPEMMEPERVYSPFVDRDYPDQALFGDTHFHTELSFDAGLIGTRLDAEDGFRFARGEEVISNTGQRVQLVRPLDFLVITDHAELIGLAPMIRNSAPELLSDPWGRQIYDLFNAGPEGRMTAFGKIIDITEAVPFINPMQSSAGARSIWDDFIETADQYNEPGRFTAMTGFEWSSTASR